MESSSNTNVDGQLPAHLDKQQIILREGNVAYDIERPLFMSTKGVEFAQLKKEYLLKLQKESPEQYNALP